MKAEISCFFLGHNWTNWHTVSVLSSREDKDYRHCTRCGKEESEEHDFSSYSQCSFISVGKRAAKTCSRCGMMVFGEPSDSS